MALSSKKFKPFPDITVREARYMFQCALLADHPAAKNMFMWMRRYVRTPHMDDEPQAPRQFYSEEGL